MEEPVTQDPPEDRDPKPLFHAICIPFKRVSLEYGCMPFSCLMIALIKTIKTPSSERSTGVSGVMFNCRDTLSIYETVSFSVGGAYRLIIR